MTSPPVAPSDRIRIRGARQHNLRNVSVSIPTGAITVISGPSGSGKSSLAFDTLYAEGQRRYVESFSAYARQFMDRMDRPDVDGVDGILPAVAIDQTNAIRSSRSSVGTVTEITDHVKGLYARAGALWCDGCGQIVRSEDPPAILADLLERAAGRRAVITFPLDVGAGKAAAAAAEWLAAEGFQRLWVDGRVVEVGDAALGKRKKGAPPLDVLVDRVVLRGDEESKARAADSLEAAMTRGQGRVRVHVDHDGRFETHPYSRGRHCAACDRSFPEPVENHFSFNSPLGACPTCNGFGRVISLDLDLAIPDHGKSLADGAIRPWTTDSTADERRDLRRFCEKTDIPLDVPWEELTAEHRRLILDGSKTPRFYGVRGWFKWLEGRTYKMHVRVLLSRYRAYVPCEACGGSRFQPHALLYRLGGLTLAELYALDIDRARSFFDDLELPREQAEAAAGLLREVRSRLRYLVEVGLGYLTLDRQSRTLSGGEVQRVNLTTAIGSHLVNTLYVLDEPSIGLHARDNERLMGILERLRRNRNTIVLVEHDDAIIRRADRVIDLGPGAGELGGQVVFEGSPAELLAAGRDPSCHSATARFLAGEGASMPAPPRRRVAPDQGLRIRGARENNLRGVDVAIPLGALTVVTGVSGSGKSTLVEDVLHRGLLRMRGEPVDAAGAHDAIEGAAGVGDIVLVDQRPVGTTPRSNPATYTKAWTAIRELFAGLPEAARRGFSGGTFSFNTAGGRCDACEGTGFERIEMQFLSDVYVTCEPCAGRRFKEDVLEVKLRGRSVADVLEMTVAEAVRFFRGDAAARRPLETLAQVGLDYLRLGQPLNTLSGGEAQRLKLAGHLGARGSKRALLLLDEPTTGLHLGDVRVLVENLHRLVDQGNTVVVIEHHLDLIAQADHVIDLGPEGGREGGAVVATGTPEQVAACEASHTGRFLRAHLGGDRSGGVREAAPEPMEAPDEVVIRGARVHNLKDVSLRIPRDRLVVVTGPSGSGKSSLAFDVLFAEGQRRFVDCLSPYARQYVQQLARPDLDELLGVPPTVSIAQKTTQSGRRSTVATITEVWHYLRLLWARLGVQHCHRCGAKAGGLTTDEVLAHVLARHDGQEVRLLAPVVRGRKGFHKDVIDRARADGFKELRVDGKLVAMEDAGPLARFKEHDVEVVVARWTVAATRSDGARAFVERGLSLGGGTIAVLAVGAKRPHTYSRERWCAACEIGFDPADPRTFSFNSAEGACPTCSGTGEQGGDDDEPTRGALACPACGGARLKPTSLAIRFDGRGIAEVGAMTPGGLLGWLEDVKLDERGEAIAGPVLGEIASRCLFLERVGLDYLTLDRGGHTLSGGEAQRIRLASQLGAQLSGVLYVLDEPTIGLHPSDNDLLLDALAELRERGNGVVIVEHDEATIRRADHIIDMGPGGGTQGGHVVAEGPLAAILASEASVTGRVLRLGAARSLRPARPCEGEPRIGVRGLVHHNLRNVDVDFPLGRLTVVTGVSGSGKSSLVRDGLARGLALRLRKEDAPWIVGAEPVLALREIDQSPIGKTPRSIPATYVGFYTTIRELFAGLPEARMRGYAATRFSFNTKGGRCEHCAGQGEVKHEMSFLPDVWVTCEVCRGRRFDEETLRVRYRDRSIDQVLAMTVDEAIGLFEAVRRVREPLQLLSDVGLGYLHLGQASNTLSGGEAQRVKLVEELSRRSTGQTVYVMDEPSTGLHLDDLRKLIDVLHRLVDRGDTVVVIEHDLDVVAAADWVVDLGPGGGKHGGDVVFQGPRDGLVGCERSRTAPYLRAHLAGHGT